jgi:hypothetical protein
VAAGPISRILSAGKHPLRGPRTAGRPFLWAAHYCAALATYPKVLTRRAGTRSPSLPIKLTSCERRATLNLGRLDARSSSLTAKSAATAKLPPYLVLLRVGFALPARLLERRCALAAPFHPYPRTPLSGQQRRYIFCGTFRQPTLTPASRTLSGTLLCGVRTFLPHHLTRQERPSGPAAYLLIIFDEQPQHEEHRHARPRTPGPRRGCFIVTQYSP